MICLAVYSCQYNDINYFEIITNHYIIHRYNCNDHQTQQYVIGWHFELDLTWMTQNWNRSELTLLVLIIMSDESNILIEQRDLATQNDWLRLRCNIAGDDTSRQKFSVDRNFGDQMQKPYLCSSLLPWQSFSLPRNPH